MVGKPVRAAADAVRYRWSPRSAEDIIAADPGQTLECGLFCSAGPQMPDVRFFDEWVKNPSIGVARRPILDSTSRIFTIGSCFANELQKAQARRGMETYPAYRSFKVQPNQIFYRHDIMEFLPHFDTFVMRQEFETMFGLWPDREDGFVKIADQTINEIFKSDTAFQDPYRLRNFAATLPALQDLARSATALMREGLERADVVVITLGLTEVWLHKKTGKYLSARPRTGNSTDEKLGSFHPSTFNENYENMKAILDLIFHNMPGKPVVITVSPVPLRRTFRQMDVGTANLESKSLLRTVAAQICRDYSDVSYFPSYEMATLFGPADVFLEDRQSDQPPMSGPVAC